MQITNPQQIKIGMEIFCAMNDPYSYVEKFYVVTSPFTLDNNELSRWVFVSKSPSPMLSELSLLTNTKSLRDCGVISNNYNTHRTFTTAEEACDYSGTEVIS